MGFRVLIKPERGLEPCRDLVVVTNLVVRKTIWADPLTYSSWLILAQSRRKPIVGSTGAREAPSAVGGLRDRAPRLAGVAGRGVGRRGLAGVVTTVVRSVVRSRRLAAQVGGVGRVVRRRWLAVLAVVGMSVVGRRWLA